MKPSASDSSFAWKACSCFVHSACWIRSERDDTRSIPNFVTHPRVRAATAADAKRHARQFWVGTRRSKNVLRFYIDRIAKMSKFGNGWLIKCDLICHFDDLRLRLCVSYIRHDTNIGSPKWPTSSLTVIRVDLTYAIAMLHHINNDDQPHRHQQRPHYCYVRSRCNDVPLHPTPATTATINCWFKG